MQANRLAECYQPLVTYVVAEVQTAAGGALDGDALRAAGAVALAEALAEGRSRSADLLPAVRAAVTAAARGARRVRVPAIEAAPAAAVMGALQQLPAAASSLLRGLYLEQRTLEDAAQVAGITADQVGAHRADALSRLGAALTKQRSATGMAVRAATCVRRAAPVQAPAQAGPAVTVGG